MAYSRLSEDDVVSTIFADEESFDDSDSESGEDIYGYLGACAIPREELIEEARSLIGSDCEVDDEEEDMLSDEHSNHEEVTHSEVYSERDDMEVDADEAEDSDSLLTERPSPRTDEDSNVHMDEAVSV